MNEKLVKINSDDDDEEVPGSTRASPMAERATQTIESAETAMALDSSTSGAGKSKSRDNIDLERGLTLSVSELEKSQQAQQQQQQEQQFRLSPMRWTILIGFCVFGFCNGLVSILASSPSFQLHDWTLSNNNQANRVLLFHRQTRSIPYCTCTFRCWTFQ